MNIDEILEKVASGNLSASKAKKLLQLDSIIKVGSIAKLDTGRASRKGIPEIILAEGKSSQQVVKIAKSMFQNSGKVIISRINSSCLKEISKTFPKKYIKTNDLARTIVISNQKPRQKLSGSVAIITAGTADIPVAEESKVILEEVGCKIITCYDVGIAGIHRLFDSLSSVIKEDVDVIIAVAGREGAMPSIIAGMVDIPVIGVPTSIGYGYGDKGISALMSMLQSCSLGIATVNIDSGIAAGVIASTIAKNKSIK
tara:strand:- start:1555 stop:2322 length:768 start_codon:yes stop_codon:yes gene_type:complete